ARNVGVIAVALFEEVPPPEPPQIIVPEADYTYDGRYTYEDDLAPGADSSTSKTEGSRGGARKDSHQTRTANADKRPAPPPASEPTTAGTGTTAGGYGGDVAGSPVRPPDNYR